MTNDKKYLHPINMLYKLISVFYNIFFSIYIYDLSQNLNFVISCYLFRHIMLLISEYLAFKLINPKNFNLFYRLSFFIMTISIAIVFTIKINILFVFISQFFLVMSEACYYMPHEIAIMSKNQKSEMKSFLGVSSILSILSTSLSPFISGYLIDYLSYYVLFVIILACAMICFILSFKVKLCPIDMPIMKVSEFTISVHKIKSVRLSYLGYALYKFSQDSVITILLPLFLFMKTGTNFSVGIYSSIATLLSGIALLVYIRLNIKNSTTMIISTTVLEIVSCILLLWTNIIAFFIYFFMSQIIKKVLGNRVCENIFCTLKDTPYKDYLKNHHMTFCFYNDSFSILAYILAIVIYNCFATTNVLGLIFLILTLIQIPSTILLIRSETIKE